MKKTYATLRFDELLGIQKHVSKDIQKLIDGSGFARPSPSSGFAPGWHPFRTGYFQSGFFEIGRGRRGTIGSVWRHEASGVATRPAMLVDVRDIRTKPWAMRRGRVCNC